MAIRITCPGCKSSYAIDNSLRGQRILCRDCQRPMVIPAAPAIKAATPTIKPTASNVKAATATAEARTRPAPSQAAPALATKSARPVDQDDAKPVRRRAAKKSGGSQIWWIVGGALGLMGIL